MSSGVTIFNGLIDEASIYNRALTASEIQAIYAVGSEGKCSAVPPTIIVSPTNQTVVVGKTASFSVMASGTSPLSYQWQLQWDEHCRGNQYDPDFDQRATRQAGSYAVTVTNLYGSILSSNAVLTVNPVPPCVPASSGLISWWPGEGNANDVAGANNGTLMNGVGFARRGSRPSLLL